MAAFEQLNAINHQYSSHAPHLGLSVQGLPVQGLSVSAACPLPVQGLPVQGLSVSAACPPIAAWHTCLCTHANVYAIVPSQASQHASQAATQHGTQSATQGAGLPDEKAADKAHEGVPADPLASVEDTPGG